MRVALLLAALSISAAEPAFDQLARGATAAREAERVDEAISLYRRALKLNPKWQEGWWFAGTLNYDKDHYPECREAFLRFTELNPKAGPAFAMLGLCEFHLERYDDSLQHLSRGNRLGLPDGSPLHRVAAYHEALLLTKLENYERALFLLSLLIRDGQEDPAAVVAMGVAGLRRPQFPREVAQSERLLVTKVGGALALGFQRRPSEARQAFEALIKENPKLPNLHYTFGSFLLGQDADAAIREWISELGISPNHLPSLISLCFEYLTRGDVASARPYAEQAMKIAPSHFTSRTAIGRVLLESGQHTAAIPHLETAARLSPNSPQIRLALANAYGRAGRQADAAREREAFAALKGSK